MSFVSASNCSYGSSEYVCSQGVSSPQSCIDSCAARIQQVLEEVKRTIPHRNDSKITCCITGKVPKDPVVTNCGHICDLQLLRPRWCQIRQNAICAKCGTAITTISQPVPFIRNLIEEWRNEEKVPTLSHFKEQNEEFANENISLANEYIEEGRFPYALHAYRRAFQYTERSNAYAAIPQIYDQLGAPDRATLSRLYLSQYQLREGKVEEAIRTVESIESDAIDLNALIVILKLLLSHSPEILDEVMAYAQTKANVAGQIAIYNQIIAINPHRFDAHRQLIAMTYDPVKRKELCLQAAANACQVGKLELETEFLCEAERPNLTVLTKDMWVNGQNLPPRPADLETWLNEPCPFTPGRIRGETHIVFPIFPQVSLDDNAPPVSLNLGTLDQLDKRTQGPGFRYLWEHIPQDTGTTENFCWGAMYRDVIPGSRNRRFDDQQRLLPEGYEVPGVYEAALGILWEQRRTGTRCFSNDPWTSTYCKEEVKGSRLTVGCFHPLLGLIAGAYYDFDRGVDCLGLGALRKFELKL